MQCLAWSESRHWRHGGHFADGMPAMELSVCLFATQVLATNPLTRKRKKGDVLVYRLWTLRICPFSLLCWTNISTELGELSPDEWSQSINLDLVTANAAS